MEKLIGLQLLNDELNDTEFKSLTQQLLSNRKFMSRLFFKLLLDEYKSDQIHQNGFFNDMYDTTKNIMHKREKKQIALHSESDETKSEEPIKLNITHLPSELISECTSYLNLNETISFMQTSKYLCKSSTITTLTTPMWIDKKNANYANINHRSARQIKLKLFVKNVKRLSLHQSYFSNYRFEEYVSDLDELNVFMDSDRKLDTLQLNQMKKTIQSINVKKLCFNLSRKGFNLYSDIYPALWSSNINVHYLSLQGFHNYNTAQIPPQSFDCFSSLQQIKKIYFEQCDDSICKLILEKLKSSNLSIIYNDSDTFNASDIHQKGIRKLHCVYYANVDFFKNMFNNNKNLQYLHLFENMDVFALPEVSLLDSLEHGLKDTKFNNDLTLVLPLTYCCGLRYDIANIAELMKENVAKCYNYTLEFSFEMDIEYKHDLKEDIEKLKQQHHVVYEEDSCPNTTSETTYIYGKVTICNKQ